MNLLYFFIFIWVINIREIYYFSYIIILEISIININYHTGNTCTIESRSRLLKNSLKRYINNKLSYYEQITTLTWVLPTIF